MTSSERALVPGASGGLPAHIEQRTRIANQVLGELVRRGYRGVLSAASRVFSVGGVTTLPAG